MSGADDQVQDAISDELERLTGNDAFRAAGLAADSMTIFEVSRDEHGTPKVHHWTYACAAAAADGALRGAEPDRWSLAVTSHDTFYARVAPRLIVRAPGELATAISDLLPGPTRTVPVYESLVPMRDLLRAALRESRLSLGYELVVLRPVPRRPDGTGPTRPVPIGTVPAGTAHAAAHDDATRLVPTGLPLFTPGDTPGREVPVRVRIEPTNGEGTFFAVGTREPRPDLPRHDRRLRPFQVQVADLPPGTYDLTATLVRPGQVRFGGLPVPLAGTDRSLDDLMGLAPSQLRVRRPVHLICLVEACGGDDLLSKRTRLEELISAARANTTALRVSVIEYGTHGVAWKVPDLPPEIRAWLARPDNAVNVLRGITGRRADKREYPRAAQLECALKLVRERLGTLTGRARDARPVIVAAGERPPHPPGLDTANQLIACPGWVNALSELRRLRTWPGITFGALRAPGVCGPVWDALGQHASATIDGVADMETFAAGLGLIATTQTVPFPLVPAPMTGHGGA